MVDRIFNLWVKSGCPFCVDAQKELLIRKESHAVHVMDERLEELEKVKTLWDHKTVPIVVLQEGDEEEFIGGFTDLMEWLERDEGKVENND